MQNHLAAVKIQDSELGKLQEKQRAAVQRSLGRVSGRASLQQHDDEDSGAHGASSDGNVYQDLQDLNFGSLGSGGRCVFRVKIPLLRFLRGGASG